MKKFAVGLFVFAVVVVGSFSVAAQTKGPEAVVCVAAKRDCEKEVRRVPLANVFRDETGAVVYAISGNESWRRTEIEVRRGQRVEVTASGVVRWAQDGIEKIEVTPDGARPPYRDGWNYYHFPFPEAGIGSLVMRIGKGVYPAGSAVVIEAEDDGFIEFMVNDDKLEDNSGGFYVKVALLSE